jgi:hypothetical protein
LTTEFWVSFGNPPFSNGEPGNRQQVKIDIFSPEFSAAFLGWRLGISTPIAFPQVSPDKKKEEGSPAGASPLAQILRIPADASRVCRPNPQATTKPESPLLIKDSRPNIFLLAL